MRGCTVANTSSTSRAVGDVWGESSPGRGPRPTGNEAGTADSEPTASRARQGTRGRAGGRHAPPSGGRSRDTSLSLCTKRGPAGRGRNHHSEIARSRRRASHTAKSSGTRAQQTDARPLRRADSRPARGTSRRDRAQSDRARCARDTAVRRSSIARPRDTRKRVPCHRHVPIRFKSLIVCLDATTCVPEER